MARRIACWSVALWLAAGCGSPADRIILISIDTLRADHVGVYGAAISPTPILDHLAGQGVRFETALAPVPLTLPSHASLLTGLDPLAHGVHGNGSFRLRDDLPLLTERLSAAGYATAAFVGAHVLDRSYGLARGFDVYDDHMGGRHAGGEGGWAERTADAVVDAALDWLETAPDRFFLWVHLYDPHALYAPPPRFRSRFGSAYDAEIAFADAQAGRLLASIGQRFALARSLVVVTSDHGESLGEHGEQTHGFGIYDATQRVPLIFAGRGVPVGGVVQGPVRLVDVAPTILALLGVEPLPDVDGIDLGPRMRGELAAAPAAYLETFATHLDMGMSPLTGLRTDRYKLIRAPRPELYDLVEDPHERNDLARQRPERVAELQRELGQRMAGAAPVRPNRALDDGSRSLLESLGYVLSDGATQTIPVDSLAGPDPKDERAMLEHFHDVATLAQQGRHAEARARVDRIRGGGFHAASTRAELALAVGDAVAAERHARAAITAHPSRAQGHFLLGRSLQVQGRLEQARAAYGASLQLLPESGRTLERLGEVAEGEGDLALAAELYGRAATSRDPIPAAAARRAALLRRLGHDDDAGRRDPPRL